MLRAVLTGAADLHTHTTHSDGACTPGDVVRAAASVGLGAVAITDHETLSAIPAARAEAERLSIELIAGAELSIELEGRRLDLLGHFLDCANEPLLAFLSDRRRQRLERFEKMCRLLLEQGLQVDLKAIQLAWPRAVLGRRHLAEYLTRTRQVGSIREVFEEYLGEGRPGNVPLPAVCAAEAMSLIHGAGGTAALAHPGRGCSFRSVERLVEMGLDALEVDGPGVTAQQRQRLRRWAEELGLAPIAGSDFHAPDRPGRWVGCVTTTPENLEQLRRRRRH